MLKKIILPIAILGVVLLVSIGSAFAQEGRRISFAKGKFSAAVSGTIGANICGETFLVRARKGQRVRVNVTSTNGKVGFDEYCTRTFSIVMNETTDYTIQPCNCGKRSTRFTLTVSIR